MVVQEVQLMTQLEILELIEELGGSHRLFVDEQKVPDPADPRGAVLKTPVSTQVFMSNPVLFESKQTDGEMVQFDDLQVFVPALQRDPADPAGIATVPLVLVPHTQLLVRSIDLATSWKVVKVTTWAAESTFATAGHLDPVVGMYELQLRGMGG